MTSSQFICATLALTLLAPAARVTAQTQPAFPIAYISVQKILAEAEDAKAAAKELDALRTARTQELNAKKKAVDDTRLQIANAGGVFSASKRAQLVELEKRQQAELQQATQQAQTDFVALQKKTQDRLRDELQVVVTALANERRVVYVLNQDTALVLAPTGANWTNDVLQRMNAAAARSGAGKPAGEKPPTKNP